jgi:hypothetical protein
MLLKTFYKDQHHFLCRFCAVSIGVFGGKTLERLPNFIQVLVSLSTGQQYQLNGCKECLTSGTPINLIQKAFDMDPSTPKKGYAKVILDSLIILKKEPQ